MHLTSLPGRPIGYRRRIELVHPGQRLLCPLLQRLPESEDVEAVHVRVPSGREGSGGQEQPRPQLQQGHRPAVRGGLPGRLGRQFNGIKIIWEILLGLFSVPFLDAF